MQRQYFVYIATNYSQASLYTGMTNDLIRRTYEHKNEVSDGFTSQYKVNKLVYYEVFNSPDEAIAREKQLKGWTRRKKINLINSLNPEWEDLCEKVL